MIAIKLTSFSISNFRSIIDSGWCSLASDNITALIGQNESGKTTVLEALNCFYTGKISDDVIRSDSSLPSVCCVFTIENDFCLEELLDKQKIPVDLIDKIKTLKEFRLIRKWLPDKTSVLSVYSDTVYGYFELKNREAERFREETYDKMKKILTGYENEQGKLEKLEDGVKVTKESLTNHKKKLDQQKKRIRRLRKAAERPSVEAEMVTMQKTYEELELLMKEKEEETTNTHQRIKELSETIEAGAAFQVALNGKEELKKEIDNLVQNISELEYLNGLSSGKTNKKELLVKIEKEVQELRLKKQELEQKEKEIVLFTKVASKIFNQEISLSEAERKAREEVASQDLFYNEYSIAKDLFEKIPVFEFFEDFSGLLPNKIDLEDLLNKNEEIEGFKAAYNFLKLAGLDSSFFREKNQRILKQKIETLNSGVTLNFQDFWSQQVGKDNKIKLHFDLEHYDYTVPEKSGKPYLEFWIKDNQERLYPKQRSRGVRWFLSFYLELRASATETGKKRVLLIDEPGMSLHARAQEDVLKVFEDLKDKMQVIYSTHSPHLINPEKLYRILAVQRADEDDDNSESLVFDGTKLCEVTADTLTPVYSMMGVRLSGLQFIQTNKNIIVPDTITYYYLNGLSRLFPEYSDIQFIPATGAHSVPHLVNILASWHINFGIVLIGQSQEESYSDIEELTLLSGDKAKIKVKTFSSLDAIEDVFSTLDFKKLILKKREGITVKNFEYIMLNSLSRKVLAINFVNVLNQEDTTIKSFDEISQTQIKELFREIESILKN